MWPTTSTYSTFDFCQGEPRVFDSHNLSFPVNRSDWSTGPNVDDRVGDRTITREGERVHRTSPLFNVPRDFRWSDSGQGTEMSTPLRM